MEKSEEIARFWERTNLMIKDKRTTQRAISKECGFIERRIETLVSNGRIPDAIEAYKIAQALGTTVEYLITDKNPDGVTNVQWDLIRKFEALGDRDKGLIISMINKMISDVIIAEANKANHIFEAQEPNQEYNKMVADMENEQIDEYAKASKKDLAG